MVTTKEVVVGQFVKSRAGRDKGKVFIVIEKLDDQFIKIADGDLRRVEKPKLKKVMHITVMKTISEDIQHKITTSKKVTNLMVRREIEKLGL